jgi:hypothetical protein
MAMMATQGTGRRGLAWAVIGGVVLIGAIVAIILSSTLARPEPEPTATSDGSHSPGGSSPTATEPGGGEFVDPDAAEHGWTPEPITTDAEEYILAALAAASTFDTTRSTREEWLDYLDAWFTPDTRYAAAEQEDRMEAAQLELRQGVVLPQDEWDSLAGEDGRVVAEAAGPVTFVPVAEDPSGDMSIGTADVTLTFTRSDNTGQETSYSETVRVSVQVLCGEGSVPSPDTAQQPGDCKVVRYFTEPLEP